VNTFAKIKHINSFAKVEYYSVCLEEDGEISLYEKFINKHTIQNKTELNHIQSWIKWIGIQYSAKSDYFRNEAETADASALPPENPNWDPTFIEWHKETKTGKTNMLRLYTFRANDHVVFLFNGDIKTADTAQNCPNVRSHFRLANTLSEVLNNCFKEGNINWNAQQTDIEFEEDLELNW
jgi:tRNA-dihydrouridine synthase